MTFQFILQSSISTLCQIPRSAIAVMVGRSLNLSRQSGVTAVCIQSISWFNYLSLFKLTFEQYYLPQTSSLLLLQYTSFCFRFIDPTPRALLQYHELRVYTKTVYFAVPLFTLIHPSGRPFILQHRRKRIQLYKSRPQPLILPALECSKVWVKCRYETRINSPSREVEVCNALATRRTVPTDGTGDSGMGGWLGLAVDVTESDNLRSLCYAHCLLSYGCIFVSVAPSYSDEV